MNPVKNSPVNASEVDPKKSYATPHLTTFGKVSELTQWTGSGTGDYQGPRFGIM